MLQRESGEIGTSGEAYCQIKALDKVLGQISTPTSAASTFEIYRLNCSEALSGSGAPYESLVLPEQTEHDRASYSFSVRSTLPIELLDVETLV